MHSKPAKALRRFCLDCQGGSADFVAQCHDASCNLFIYRMCTLGEDPEEARPLRAIRRYCMECAGNRGEVRACDAKEECSLWSYRFGVSPAVFKQVTARRRRKQEMIFLPGFKPQA